MYSIKVYKITSNFTTYQKDDKSAYLAKIGGFFDQKFRLCRLLPAPYRLPSPPRTLFVLHTYIHNAFVFSKLYLLQ